jgi:hypothetical protein
MSASGGDDFALGTPVLISGTVVGRSEFQSGPPAYLVEFDKKGRSMRDWFIGADLDVELEENGGGI